MIKAIIVEDEKRSAALLANLLKQYCEDVNLVGTAYTVAEAKNVIVKEKPDVIFLDIEMQHETGFDLLDKFDAIDFKIIFTTAYEQYALKAIKCCALDYLLKPIDLQELKSAVTKVKDEQNRQLRNENVEAFIRNRHQTKAGQLQMALPSSDGMSIVKISEILYLKSERQYTSFILKNGTSILTSKNIGEYEELLLEHGFYRVHHSSLVNLVEVTKYMRGDGGQVIMSNGDYIDISKRRKEAFLLCFEKR